MTEQIRHHLEHLRKVSEELSAISDLRRLNFLERTGVAALLFDFYNGVENILKLALKVQGIEIPASESWHKDFLETARHSSVVSDRLYPALQEFLGFRHVFAKRYSQEIELEKLIPLLEKVAPGMVLFEAEMERVGVTIL